MSTFQTIHYELDSSADLDRLVADLETLDAGTFIVAFRESSSWSATDIQIARLVAVARTLNKRLIAERGSSQAADRALRLGFRDIGVVTDSPEPNQHDTSSFPSYGEDPTRSIAPLDRFSSTANLATYKPENDSPTRVFPADNDPEPEDDDAHSSATTAMSVSHGKEQGNSSGEELRQANKPTEQPSPLLPAKVRQSVPIMRQGSADSSSRNRSSAPPPPANRRRLLKLIAAIIAPVFVLGVVGALALYMLPTAEITLIAEEEPISTSLTYGIALANTEYDISLDPTMVRSTSNAEATRESTGERFEPAGTAAGTVQITNPLTNEVTIPAGTELPGANGVTYYTAEDVRLPAADPYGSMSFGSGSVGVYAGVTGPDGNLDAGALTGQLGTQMFFTNPEAISGGRMDRYPVISDEDVEQVRDDVRTELLDIAEDEFLNSVSSDLEVVPGSIEVGDPEIEVSGSSGEDGDEVSASGTISVQGQVYDPAELHEVAGSEADRQLARQGGSDRILLAETVTLRDPTDLDGDAPAFQIDVEAMARKVITETEKEAIVAEVTGLTRSEAEELLENHPKIERFQINIEPSWLLDRMPEISSRIEVHVSSGEPTASTR
jgi:hypothetical protein